MSRVGILFGSVYSISSYSIILREKCVALNLHRKVNLLQVLCCVYPIKPTHIVCAVVS